MQKILGYCLIGVGAVVTIYIRLSHMDMTETRLFVTYWWVWIVLAAIILYGAILTTRSARR
jgi:hypothetical protein